jgi:thiol-disulfide isomerase/thioredoxin
VNRLWLLLLVAILGLMYLLQQRGGEQSSSDFIVRLPPRPLPPVMVTDGGGGKIDVLDELRGKFVLLNVWATWCVPCRREMPTLDRLQERLGGTDFQVVAVSIDKGAAEAVRKFYDRLGIRRLSVRVAVNSDELLAALGAYGVPTTLLVDRQSREIGRLVGSANWDSTEMIDFLKMRIAQ